MRPRARAATALSGDGARRVRRRAAWRCAARAAFPGEGVSVGPCIGPLCGSAMLLYSCDGKQAGEGFA